MSPAEVVAVEVRQYLDDSTGLTSLVPRIVGSTAAAERKKAARPQTQTWNEASVFERLEEQLGAEQRDAARAIYDWGREAVPEVRWGKGSVDGSFTLVASRSAGPCPFLAVYTTGHVELRFGALRPRSVHRGGSA